MPVMFYAPKNKERLKMDEIIKQQKRNDICRLKRFAENIASEYLDLMQSNQDIGFSFKALASALDTLRLETAKFADTVEKSLPPGDVIKDFKPAPTRAEIMKMGNIKTRRF